jgi:hypothetical protein
MEHIHLSSTWTMTTILIGIITLLLSVNFILDTDKPCPVEWSNNLRNHQQRLDLCKLVSQNGYMEWVLKD